MVPAKVTHRIDTRGKDKRIKIEETALELSGNNTTILYNAAMVFALTGDKARLLETAKAAIDGGYPRSDFSTDPAFAAYRDDREFISLLEAP